MLLFQMRQSYSINNLQNGFEKNGSEIETAAREGIIEPKGNQAYMCFMENYSNSQRVGVIFCFIGILSDGYA